jgi:hypothetical protein
MPLAIFCSVDASGQRPCAGGLDGVMPLALAAAGGGRLAEPRLHEAARLQPIERRVECTQEILRVVRVSISSRIVTAVASASSLTTAKRINCSNSPTDSPMKRPRFRTCSHCRENTLVVSSAWTCDETVT